MSQCIGNPSVLSVGQVSLAESSSIKNQRQKLGPVQLHVDQVKSFIQHIDMISSSYGSFPHLCIAESGSLRLNSHAGLAKKTICFPPMVACPAVQPRISCNLLNLLRGDLCTSSFHPHPLIWRLGIYCPSLPGSYDSQMTERRQDRNLKKLI